MESNLKRGFTVMELLIVIAIIGLIATIVMVGQRNAQEKRRDLRRVTDVKALQDSLALYLAKVGAYPVYTGCINGTDLVTVGLRVQGMIGSADSLVDPLNPDDTASCYYYTGAGGSQFNLRYTLEQTSAAGEVGDHVVVP
jgi:prepilin-type N-terminal cleavage/methylation domain-containing protein